MPEHLKFAPSILRRLGEELIPQPEQGIVELVRNSYDADATICRVELDEAERKGGTARVGDDGRGMTRRQITSGLLTLGRSPKSATRRTEAGRLTVGEKGLGRLAALRLGRVAEIVTRPEAEPGTEHRVVFDWRVFDSADTVEDVAIDIETTRTRRGPGTEIEVRDLTVRFGKRETTRLARALLLLSDPFASEKGFRAELIGTEYRALELLVREAYFDQADLHVEATLRSNGTGSAVVRDRAGRIRWRAQHEDLVDDPDDRYACPAATFELWVFVLVGERFSDRTATLGELRKWLDVVGGVHLYHRNLRVHPYGDEGHDWLEMNLARVRSPELRPSTNTSIGRVIVEDPDELLTQKTDRSGFIENEAFQEIRRFAIDTLEWLADTRLKDRERTRGAAREETRRAARAARTELDKALDRIPAGQRDTFAALVDRFDKARAREAETLRDDLQLYRTLGTVGTTVAMFAHEAVKPAAEVKDIGRSLQQRLPGSLKIRYAGSPFERRLSLLVRYANRLKLFSQLPLKLLEREKRRSRVLDFNPTVDSAIELFKPYLDEARIALHVQLAAPSPNVRGTVAAVESIVANLLINAATALRPTSEFRAKSRDVHVRSELSKDDVVLRVLDSGAGIQDLTLDEIWLPGKTTTKGTGLGLTIVRDTVIDLGGRVAAVAHGELGGAEFIITLPVIRND
jgi:signal transduction histidine kinase